MKFNFQSKWLTSDFPKPGEAFSPRFISNFALMVAELKQGLGGLLTFADNSTSAIITVPTTNGAAQNIVNPLRNGNPVGAVIIAQQDSGGAYHTPPSLVFKPTVPGLPGYCAVTTTFTLTVTGGGGGTITLGTGFLAGSTTTLLVVGG